MTITVVQAKLASMIAIGVGSFIVGIAPVCFVSRIRDLQQRLLLSCTLCFGGGVLLATSILHMLPETREGLPKHAELVFASGYLLLYIVDEAIHYFWGSDVDYDPELHQQDYKNRNPGNQIERCRAPTHQVSCSASTKSIGCVHTPEANAKSLYQTNLSGNRMNNSWKSTYGAVEYGPTAPASCYIEEQTFLCHGNHTEPCANSSSTSLVGLLLALTVHSILEGQAIGLQKATSEVLLLVGAVASHKFVVGFCLGLELADSSGSIARLLLASFVFSAGSVVGIGSGMIMLRMRYEWMKIGLPILQGLAGGSLLYVTVSEILPRERARWHMNPQRSAGIFQFCSAFVGFVIIFLLNSYLGT